MPRVSVAILAFYEEYLSECVRSVLDQSYADLKVIIYDDNTRADLKAVIDKFDDPRLVHVKNEKNLQERFNFNQAMDLCDTDYISIFHGDDRMFSWMIEETIQVMNDNLNVGLVSTSKFVIDGFYPNDPKRPARAKDILYKENRLIEKEEPRKLKHFLGIQRQILTIQEPLMEMHDIPRSIIYKKNEMIKAIALGKEMYKMSSSILYRKKTMDHYDLRYRRLPYKRGGDAFFFIEANNRGVEICILKIPLFAYRKHDSSISDNISFTRSYYSFMFLNSYIDTLKLGVPTDGLKNLLAITILESALYGRNIDGASFRKMYEVFERSGWIKKSRRKLKEFVTIKSLAHLVWRVGLEKITFNDYITESIACRRKGLPISLLKELEWFVKYILPRKIAKHSSFFKEYVNKLDGLE